MCELSAHIFERIVVYLAYYLRIPTAEVGDSVVNEEIVRVDIICPAVALAVAPPERFLMHNETAYEEILIRPRIYLRHIVQLPIVLEYGRHCFSERLLVSVSSNTHWLLGLRAVHAKHVAHKPADKVGLQRSSSLLYDILLLGHRLAVHYHLVAPLVAVIVIFVALPVFAELAHSIPIVLRKEKDVCRFAVIVELVVKLDRVHLGSLSLSKPRQRYHSILVNLYHILKVIEHNQLSVVIF